MKLWTQWLQAVWPCARHVDAHAPLPGRFLSWWVCVAAPTTPFTSFVRVLNFSGQAYHRFLHLFHSTRLDLDVLLVLGAPGLVLFHPFEVHSRLVCLADGIKAPKEGRRMPGVKYLHQQSASNTGPVHHGSFAAGHLPSCALWRRAGGCRAADFAHSRRPGVFQQGCQNTLGQARGAAIFNCTRLGPKGASGGRRLLRQRQSHHAPFGQRASVAHARQEQRRGLSARAPSGASWQGATKNYGNKVRLKDLAQDDSAFICAPSPVYGERDVWCAAVRSI